MHRPLPFHIYFYQPPRAYSDIWSIDTEILQARKQISSRSALIFSNVAPRKYISSLFSKERLQNKASSINHLSPINSLSPSTTLPNLLLQASRQMETWISSPSICYSIGFRLAFSWDVLWMQWVDLERTVVLFALQLADYRNLPNHSGILQPSFPSNRVTCSCGRHPHRVI